MRQAIMLPGDQFNAAKMHAVFIRRRNGTEFIAFDGDHPALFYDREAARQLKLKLQESEFRCLLRPVFVTITAP